jgi:hypothetical protein
MSFTLHVTTTGYAFHNEETGELDPGAELARILREMANQVDPAGNYIIGDGSRDTSGRIYDYNGNNACLWTYTARNASVED